MSLVPRRSHVLTDVRVVESESREVTPAEVRAMGVLGNRGRFGSARVSRRPEQTLDETYYANVYVYGCVRAIANDLAARPFRVGADPESPNDFDPNHPLAVRLGPPPGGPNAQTSARRLIAWSAAQRLVLGALAWQIDGDLRFWPLPGSDLKANRQEDGRKVVKSGWYESFEIGEGRDKRTLRADEVFYSWQPAQDDWGRPESALEAAALDVQVAVMQDIYDNAFIKNDARPASIVVHQSFTEESDKRKFRRQFLNRHQGPANAGRVAFVETDTSRNGAAPKDSIFVQTLGLSQRDAQMVERYEKKLRSICVAFGVPLSRLGDASERTFSNADRETLNYWLDTVQPLGLDIADDINMDLMPLFDSSGNVGWFDWSGVPALQPIKRFTVGDVLSLRRDGLITDEEARVEIGMDPDVELPIIDTVPEVEPAAPVVPLALVPGEDPVAAAAPQIVGQVAALLDDAVAKLSGQMRSVPVLPPVPGPPHTPTLDEYTGNDVESQARAAHEYRRATWSRVDRTVRREEAKWERKFNGLLEMQAKSVESRLTGKRGRQALTRAGEDDVPATVVADEVFDRNYWVGRTAEMFRDLFGDVTSTALTAFDVQFNVAFDVASPWAQNYIEERANYLAGRVTDTTYKGIKRALADGVGKGESIPDLAKRIEGLFNQTYASRATTVARTEVISAYNGSTWLAAQEADPEVIGGVMWIATLDDVTRDSHADMDGEIIGRGEWFELDGATMMYPGDPELATRYNSDGDVPDPGSMIINCRCTCAPVLSDEVPPRERSAASLIALAEAERLLTRVALGDPLDRIIGDLHA